MPNLTDISDAAGILLDAIRAAFARENVSLPTRQYLALGGRGETIHDCEQVTVSWEMSYTGLPGQQSQLPVTCDTVNSGVFVCELVRRLPVSPNGGPIGPQVLTDSAVSRMKDAILLHQAGLDAIEMTAFGKGIVDVQAGTPQGDYQAVILSWIITL